MRGMPGCEEKPEELPQRPQRSAEHAEMNAPRFGGHQGAVHLF